MKYGDPVWSVTTMSDEGRVFIDIIESSDRKVDKGNIDRSTNAKSIMMSKDEKKKCGHSDDEVTIDDLSNAILDPKSESGQRGKGRMAQAIGEDGERFADGVFIGIRKIPTDPDNKVHTSDFISDNREFLVESKAGIVSMKADKELVEIIDSRVHPEIPVIPSRGGSDHMLRKIIRETLKHTKSKEDGYNRIEELFGTVPEYVYTFCPMDFEAYTTLDLKKVPIMLSDYDFDHYGTGAFVIYLKPTSIMTGKGTHSEVGGECYVYYQDESKIKKSHFRRDDIEFKKVDCKKKIS